jgi:hypothetical protein
MLIELGAQAYIAFKPKVEPTRLLVAMPYPSLDVLETGESKPPDLEPIFHAPLHPTAEPVPVFCVHPYPKPTHKPPPDEPEHEDEFPTWSFGAPSNDGGFWSLELDQNSEDGIWGVSCHYCPFEDTGDEADPDHDHEHFHIWIALPEYEPGHAHEDDESHPHPTKKTPLTLVN